MTQTEIEWADAVWNPTAGCDRVSPGCDHCYAMTMAKRLKGMGQAKYQQDGDPRTSGPGFLAHEWPDALEWPLTKVKPLRIFVDSMADLFHDNISDDYIAHVFAVMALSPHHTFQVLTKRHARMRSLLTNEAFLASVPYIAGRDLAMRLNEAGKLAPRPRLNSSQLTKDMWPLPNVWLGISVENQQWADIRIPALLDTPAAVRFLSCEPLLGPVDLAYSSFIGGDWLTGLGWVICGGESGPGARPMHPGWARSLRDQCVAADVPFLFKQWGEWVPLKQLPAADHWSPNPGATPETTVEGKTVYRAGKHRAGRELDGRTWDQYPSAYQHTDQASSR